jgi:hypothetical protein
MILNMFLLLCVQSRKVRSRTPKVSKGSGKEKVVQQVVQLFALQLIYAR